MERGRGPTGVKSARMRRMQKMLQGAGDVDLVRFTATCEYQMGLTRERIREYLETLKDLGFIEIDEATDIVREVAVE